MNPVTAIAFLFAGLSLLLLRRESPPRLARLMATGLAVSVALIALLCLSRFYTPWDLGPDRHLFPDQLAGGPGELSNRMAPNTGVAFLLLAFALIVLDHRTKRGWHPAPALASVAGATALVAAIGYAYDTSSLYTVRSFFPMAFNTALGFLVLSAGVLVVRPAFGLPSLFLRPSFGGVLARRLLLPALVVPVVLGWLCLRGEEAGLYGAASGVALMVTATTLAMVVLVWLTATRTDRAERAQARVEQELRELNEHLEKRVAERTEELARVNEKLRLEVDERFRVEASLLEQRALLRQVIDANPQLVFVKDWDGRFVLANQAVADIYDTTVDALIGKTDEDFNSNAAEVRAFLEADREVIFSRHTKTMPEEQVTDARTGEARWFHTVKVPLAGADGRLRQMLGVSTDISARRRVKEELQRTTEELRALFDASPLAICSLTSDGRVRSWNRAAESMFGWTAKEIAGSALPNIPPDLRDEHERLRNRVLAGAPFANFETRRVRKDGQSIEVSLSTAPLYDTAGAIRGVVGMYADIRDRKGLEAQFRQAQKMEAVGRLAGGMAHDFNNLLTVIKTTAEFLLADLDGKDSRRADVAEIRDAADRAAHLTRQLLAFSRQQVHRPRVLDLNVLITQLEPMIRRLVEENIDVAVRLAPGLDRVTADPNQLDQVILNLVVNARDAMAQGGTLILETSNVVLDEDFPRSHLNARPGPHVLLTVTDTGHGMDAATQARIFEPFFTTKPVGQGTGLGLATVYGIVQQSGGHIWVYSEVGQGTTFKIYLPQGAALEEEPLQTPPSPQRRDSDALARTILLVEDDPAVRGAVRRLLEREGYGVLQASNGREALAVLAQSSGAVDLVLSDMVMPEMSGLEFRHRLRELHLPVPVLLMSGYSEETITRLGSPESLHPLIEKPFTVEEILQKIKRMLAVETGDA